MDDSNQSEDISMDNLFGIPDDDGDNNRSNTPYDHVLDGDFVTTPIVRNTNTRAPPIPKKVSANVFSSSSSSSAPPKKVLPSVFSSANTGLSRHPNAPPFPNRQRQPHSPSTQPESQVKSPARIVQEETSYDDDEGVVGNVVLPKAAVLAKAAVAEVVQPVPSIFGGSKTLKKTKSPKPPVVILSDDSDDDVMIVDHNSCSQEAQSRWSSQSSQKRKSPTSFDQNVVVKKEKSDDSPLPELSEAENLRQNSGDSGAASSSRRNSGAATPPATQVQSQPQISHPIHQPRLPTPLESQGASSLSRPKQDLKAIIAAQQEMAKKKPHKNAPIGRPAVRQPEVAESSAAGAARNPIQPIQARGTVPVREDDSWMEEDDGDELNKELEIHNERVELRDRLIVLQNQNKITEEQKLTLHKLIKDLRAKRLMDLAAKTAATPDSEDEDDLFVPEDRPRISRPKPTGGFANVDNDDNENDSNDDHNEGMQHMLAEQFGNLGKNGSKPRKKPTTKRAGNAREFFAQQQEKSEKDRSKAQKKKGRQAPVHSAPTTRTRARAAAKEPATGRGKGKGGKGKAAKSKSKDGKGKDGKGKDGKGKDGKGKDGKGKKKKGPITNGRSLLGNSTYLGADQVGQMMLDNLMTNDPIADRLGPGFDVEPEPNIEGRKTKETQFQTLFANYPRDNPYATSSAANDKKQLREASRSFGYAKCKAVDGKWLIKGMKSTLYHHQLLGAQWMLQRELNSQPPHGGLLADSMGLGKTVQTLACMVGNPPPQEDIDRGIKATLIVVPAAVLQQWWDEIELHCDKKIFSKVMRYRSSSPISRAVLEDLDIVLTTYHEVMKEFPFPNTDDRAEIAQSGYQEWFRKRAVQNLGLLHQISWYRVVLDEAQAIKNNNARTSLACQNLRSMFRWCLTGTPLLNRLEELFPYLRFLKANYSMDMQTFQRYFCDQNAEECYSRISTLLSYTMMRRTMKTTILNRPIITLPMPHPEILSVQFSPEETVIYRITENRFRDNLNMYFAKGEARRNYGIFVVQLLRLRQCTSHPFMLEKTIRESWTLEDIEELKSKITRLGRNAAPFYKQCKVWVGEIVKKRDAMKTEDDGQGFDEYSETADELMPFGQSKYGHKFNIDKAISTLSERELMLRVTCGLCSDMPIDPVKGDCGHMFCRVCFDGHIEVLLAGGDEPETLTCPTCGCMVSSIKPVKPANLPINDPFNDDDASSGGGSGNARGSQERRIHDSTLGRDALGTEPYTAETWLTRSDIDEDFPLTPSAKTAALKAVLLKGFKDAPLDKVVIYVQFRTLARIVGRICKKEGWGFLYLTSDSSLDHRSKAIKMFRDDDNIKILIAGLKCGGLGLNFPWANRCISLDLWWNHAVEQQAFGRIFRIGQNKETYMTRIVVKNSVDQRLLTMQLHKLQGIEKAIRDGPDNEDKSTLSIKQLANLFGFLRTSADGAIVSIEPDYNDDDGLWDPESGTSAAAQPQPRQSKKGKGKGKGKARDDDGDEEMDDETAEEMVEGYARGEHGTQGEYGRDGGDYNYSGLDRAEFRVDEGMDLN